MDNLYNNAQYCMEFSNREILEYFIQPAEKNNSAIIRISTDREENISRNTGDKIRSIGLDGEKDNMSVLFCDHLTALFVLNEEFMFFDDNAKEYQTSSETYGNVVYEGTIRGKSHQEILKIIYELYTIVKDAKELKIEETIIKQEGYQYPQCDYVVRIKKDTNEKSIIQFENIKFVINE